MVFSIIWLNTEGQQFNHYKKIKQLSLILKRLATFDKKNI